MSVNRVISTLCIGKWEKQKTFINICWHFQWCYKSKSFVRVAVEVFFTRIPLKLLPQHGLTIECDPNRMLERPILHQQAAQCPIPMQSWQWKWFHEDPQQSHRNMYISTTKLACSNSISNSTQTYWMYSQHSKSHNSPMYYREIVWLVIHFKITKINKMGNVVT